MILGLKNKKKGKDTKQKITTEDDYSFDDIDFDEQFKQINKDENTIIDFKSKETQVLFENNKTENSPIKQDETYFKRAWGTAKIDNSKLEKLKNLTFTKPYERKPLNVELSFQEMQNNDVDESNNFLINRKRENERKLKNDKITENIDFIEYDCKKENNFDQYNTEKISYDYIKPTYIYKSSNIDGEKGKIKIKFKKDPNRHNINNNLMIEENEPFNFKPDSNINIIDEDDFEFSKLIKSTKIITMDFNKHNNFFENTDEICVEQEHLGKNIDEEAHEQYSIGDDKSKIDKNFQKEIQKIIDIKNKKRKILPTDETYDQDFIEIKNLKTDVLLNKQKDLSHNESFSESEKEILEWEMEKLKNGISSINNRVLFNNKGLFQNGKDERKKDNSNKTNLNLKNYFKNINTETNFQSFLDKIKNECKHEENKIEYEFSKIDSLNGNIKRTKEQKELNFQKTDFYINQYKKMKKYYFDLIKLQKSKNLFVNF